MSASVETQSQRWVKYGFNVAFSTLLVVLIAAGLVYLAQRRGVRLDTTVASVNTLKPQTLAVLKTLDQNVRIVSLYPRAQEKGEQDYFQPVADLLEEYARRGVGGGGGGSGGAKSGGGAGRITVDFIDPVNEPGKLDALIQDVTARYSDEIKPYDAFLKEFPGFVTKFKAFADAQGKAVTALPVDQVTDTDLAQTLLTAQATLTSLPDRLKEASDKIDRRLKGNIPNYRGAVEDCQFELAILEQLLARVIDDFKALPPPPKTPQEIKAYTQQTLGDYEANLKLVQDELAKAKALPELKLAALRDSIQRRTILVMGDKDMKVLGFSDVWQAPDDLRTLISNSDEKPRLKFAGEQQISTALVALQTPGRPLVIVVRPGGGPLTQSLFSQAPFSGVARRLKQANFDVVEKDLSGRFAMQAQMQGIPVTEATDEQMRNRKAVWIAFSGAPAFGPNGPSPLPGQLKQHLDEGGSAVLLVEPGRDSCDTATKDLGLVVKSDQLIVKEVPRSVASVDSGDIIDNAQRVPYIFFTNDYGVSPITRPINSLQGLLLPLTPVKVDKTPPAGVSVTPILPVTRVIRTWGKTEFESVLEGKDDRPEFSEAKDTPNTEANPLYAGGLATKGDTRLVVFGTATSFSNNLLNLPDPELEKQGYLTPRFPANAELIVNAVLWAAKQDTMLEISPNAMEVARIRPIPAGTLQLLRYGVVFGLVPGAVLAAGALVYLKRRD